MSGGKYNYIQSQELTQYERTIQEIVELLEGKSLHKPANRLREILDLMGEINEIQLEMYFILESIDRYGSGDDSFDTVLKSVNEWEKSIIVMRKYDSKN